MRVWIDTDPVISARNGKVDDAFALIMALRSAELEVVGISAVYGNASADHAYAKAKDIVQYAGHADMPLPRGAVWKRGRPALNQRQRRLEWYLPKVR
jgi:inosine-uridine nucleoside N-ribohydrolase